MIQSALEGIVAPEHIFGTELDYDPVTGEIRSIARVPAGYGKVAVLEEIAGSMNIGSDRTIYIGDGSSDVHAMLHVNNRDGFTISVSENQHLAQIAKRTVLSDSAFSVVLPVLEHVFGWHSVKNPRALSIVRRAAAGLGTDPHGRGQGRRVGVIGRDHVAPGGFSLRGTRVMAEWLGWTATAVFTASYFCRQAASLRRVQMLGALVGVRDRPARAAHRGRQSPAPRGGRGREHADAGRRSRHARGQRRVSPVTCRP